MSSAKLFLIQDTRSYCGNSVMWWGPGRCGYTIDIDKAGRYSEEEARRQERCRSTDRAIPLEVALAAAGRHVQADHLYRELEAANGGEP